MNLISKLAFLALAKASAAGAHEFVRGNRIGDATQAEVEDTMEVDADKVGSLHAVLHVKVLYCKDLPDYDTWCFFCGETDAFVRIGVWDDGYYETGDHTSTKRDTLNPVWNEEFDFDISDLNKILSVRLYDHETGPSSPLISSDFIGLWELQLSNLGLDDKGTTKKQRLNLNEGGHCMIELGYAYYSCYKEDVENKWSDCGKGCGSLGTGWNKHPTYKTWGNHCDKWKVWKKNWYCQKVKLDCPSPPCRRCSASEIAEEALADE